MSNKEYMNIYMKRRWEIRRARAIEYLGAKCIECGSKNNLEFDHKDPNSK